MATKTCPSAQCAPGAQLLGVQGADGRIKFARTRMSVTAEFVEQARAHGEPEAHMRFAAPCAEGRCSQWTGSVCGLIERVMAHIEDTAPGKRGTAVRPCPIRAECRWYSQVGAEACSACDLVVRQPSQEVAG